MDKLTAKIENVISIKEFVSGAIINMGGAAFVAI